MPLLCQSSNLTLSQNPVLCSIVRLRKVPSSILRTLGHHLSCEWPMEPNTARGGRFSILWIAPGEWAVMGADQQNLASTVERVCRDLLWQVSDQSAALTAFDIQGPASRALMSACCPLDWHPRVFAAGRCAQTLFAQIQALIHQTGDSPCYRVYVDTSLSHHARDWLIDAASSIGSSVAELPGKIIWQTK